ncbi:MAG TPA: trypsin-like peptidase domain-containing protein [Dehalococcoidia bacterium]|nr:trypsin-like peptidase domain-containing protein [Dehalococcoidia bacterium]
MAEPGNTLSAFSDALAAAVERAAAGIVSVHARRRQPASGVAFTGGVIVTADHVIEQEEEIGIGLPDGKRVAAKLVGRDAGTDLAVLRPDGTAPAPLALGGAARPGTIVLAVGRPGAGGPVVSLGVVSSVSGPARTWRGGQLEGVIRTDATMYPGFSGGPLIDASGAMLGLNTTGLSRGGGLTLSVATVQRVVGQLVQHGKVRRGFLGISSQPLRLPDALAGKLEGQSNGLLIVGTEAGGPAEKGGLLVGDILVGLAGAAVKDTDDLQAQLGGERIGQSLPLKVLRGGDVRELNVTIGERG